MIRKNICKGYFELENCAYVAKNNSIEGSWPLMDAELGEEKKGRRLDNIRQLSCRVIAQR